MRIIIKKGGRSGSKRRENTTTYNLGAGCGLELEFGIAIWEPNVE